MDDVRITKNLFLSSLVIAIGSSFLFGWNLGALNNIVNPIKELYNQTWTENYDTEISPNLLIFMWSLTTSIFIFGGICGAVLGGHIADILGRKLSLLFDLIIAFTGILLSAVCVVAKCPELLIVGRFMLGLHSGISNSVCPLYLCELSPKDLRGSCGSIHQLFITFGILLSSIFGLEEILGSQDMWQYQVLIQIIPLCILLISYPFLHESPRYLYLKKDNIETATRSLKFYRQSENVQKDIDEMNEEIAGNNIDMQSNSIIGILRNKDLRKPLLIAITLQFCQQFSGISSITFYSAGIFARAGISSELIPYSVIATNAVTFLFTILAVRMIDKKGRRPMLLTPMVIMGCALALMTICLVFEKKAWFLSYVSAVCVIIFVTNFSIGLGPIPTMIAAEFFRQELRPKAMAIVNVFSWTCAFIIGLSFESVQSVLKNYTFVPFFIIIVVSIVFVYYLVPETKGKTNEEVANLFSSKSHAEIYALETLSKS